MKLHNAIQNYISDQASFVSPATTEWYAKRLKPLSPLANKQLNRIKPDELRRAWVELANRKVRWSNHPSGRSPAKGGLSPYTLAGYIRCWRAFFQWCVERGYMERNPASSLKMPPLPDQPPKALSESDLQKLLAAAKDNPRDYAIVCVLADSGCRVGGLVSLTLDALNLRRGRALVCEKGRAGGKQRTIYFKARTLQAIRDYLGVRPASDFDNVFLGKKKGPLTPSGVHSLLERLAICAKVKGRSNPHAFRHGFARGAVENGVDLSQVSQLLGHRDVSVTVKFYARWADNELKRAHARASWLPD